jgi:tRNA (cytidine32/uridine32-2'-O)-methyltransferase
MAIDRIILADPSLFMMNINDDNFLKSIRFVLVETSLSGNLGAVARALKTMGLFQLACVQARCTVDAQALARAAGADDVLASATWHETLIDALHDCQFVVGASARLRHIEWPILTPNVMAQRLLTEVQHGSVAIVLGREQSGLTNEELAYCHYLVHIPTNPEFNSLNLGAAAQVLAYEIRQAWLSQQQPSIPSPSADISRELATSAEMNGFFQHLMETLTILGFAHPRQSQKLQQRLHRLFNRARLDRTEINILRGILNAASHRRHE